MEGNGTMTLMKGSKKYVVYKGQFVAGKKEGRGTIKITTSKKLRLTAPKSRMVTYEGEWKADYCHGQGRITYIDGSVYEGNFVENRKVGNGKMQFTPTDEFLAEYDGDWKEDAEDGQGKLTFKDRTTYSRVFKDGIFEGRVTFKYANEATSEGTSLTVSCMGRARKLSQMVIPSKGSGNWTKRKAASPTPKVQGKPANRST